MNKIQNLNPIATCAKKNISDGKSSKNKKEKQTMYIIITQWLAKKTKTCVRKKQHTTKGENKQVRHKKASFIQFTKLKAKLN